MEDEKPELPEEKAKPKRLHHSIVFDFIDENVRKMVDDEDAVKELKKFLHDEWKMLLWTGIREERDRSVSQIALETIVANGYMDEDAGLARATMALNDWFDVRDLEYDGLLYVGYRSFYDGERGEFQNRTEEVNIMLGQLATMDTWTADDFDY